MTPSIRDLIEGIDHYKTLQNELPTQIVMSSKRFDLLKQDIDFELITGCVDPVPDAAGVLMGVKIVIDDSLNDTRIM